MWLITNSIDSLLRLRSTDWKSSTGIFKSDSGAEPGGSRARNTVNLLLIRSQYDVQMLENKSNNEIDYFILSVEVFSTAVLIVDTEKSKQRL